MKQIILIAALIVFGLPAGAHTWTADKAGSQLRFRVSQFTVSEADGTFERFIAVIRSDKPDFSDAVFELNADAASINTGNNPTAGCFVRVNFQQSFSNAAHVLISPVSAGAGSIGYYVDRNNSGFSICSNNVPGANQAFAFDYFVTN